MNKNTLWLLLCGLVLLRLLSLFMYPLMDTTESRYGEMARLMVETGNWLTPQFDYGVPFWGKPPLFVWLSALGIEGFGVSEFAVRFPHWLAGMATIGLMAWFAARLGYSALMTAVVLASCGIFYIASGAVMTDMVLTFSLSLAMVGFYLAWDTENKHHTIWAYVGFIGLALGLLSKGPVAIVIMGIAIMPWLFLQHGWGAFKALWARLPLLSGSALMLLIAAPWYFMAEAATPGFLDYFFVGEHFKRFTESGWQGDLYGSAHERPRGMIWLFWLLAAMPWSFVLLALLTKDWGAFRSLWKDNALVSFLCFWLVSPLILFTFAGNILPAYVLPGVPALGLLIAVLLKDKQASWFSSLGLLVPVLLLVVLWVLNNGFAEQKSDRALFHHVTTEEPVFYVGHRPFSGQFYSAGQAKLLTDNTSLQSFPSMYLIGKSNAVLLLTKEQGLSCQQRFKAASKRVLYYCAYPKD